MQQETVSFMISRMLNLNSKPKSVKLLRWDHRMSWSILITDTKSIHFSSANWKAFFSVRIYKTWNMRKHYLLNHHQYYYHEHCVKLQKDLYTHPLGFAFRLDQFVRWWWFTDYWLPFAILIFRSDCTDGGCEYHPLHGSRSRTGL